MVFESHSFPPKFFDYAQIMQVLLYYFLFIIILGRRRKTKEQKLVQATESPDKATRRLGTERLGRSVGQRQKSR